MDGRNSTWYENCLAQRWDAAPYLLVDLLQLMKGGFRTSNTEVLAQNVSTTSTTNLNTPLSLAVMN